VSEHGITLLHLYPRELGINGDVGNVTALAKRAEWRGMPLRVLDHEIGSPLPDAAHLVHIGSGPVSAQELVREDLYRIAPRLREWAAGGVPFLAIAGGWQLLGRELTALDGSLSIGAGVFPSSAVLTTRRAVDEVAASGDIAGFENHGAVTTLLDGALPLATTLHGRGNAAGGGPARGAAEGVIAGGSVGTNLHGPFLPMNPSWADRLLESAAALAGVPYGDDDGRCAQADDYARKSRAAIRSRLGV
jgi:CobQ-like glutamine amidotransferase family enzyme